MAEEHDNGTFPASVLCRLLDITEARFHQLVRMGVVPKEARGRYPLAGAVRGYIRFLKKTGSAADIPPEQLEPFQRKAHYAAALQKLSLQREAGELVPAIEMEDEMAAAFKIVSRFMDTLPDILERDCGLNPAQIQLVEQRADKARDELYLALVNRDGSGNQQPAAKTA